MSNNPDHISENLVRTFWVKKLKSFDAIKDGKNSDPDKHPGSATLSTIQFFIIINKKVLYRAAPGEHLVNHNGHDLAQDCPMPHIPCNKSIFFKNQSID
jgi:hypothetical protein